MTDDIVRRIPRVEIFSYVVVSALIVGLFNWVGIAYLESAAQSRYQRATNDRKNVLIFERAILTNERIMCVHLGVTCSMPVPASGE